MFRELLVRFYLKLMTYIWGHNLPFLVYVETWFIFLKLQVFDGVAYAIKLSFYCISILWKTDSDMLKYPHPNIFTKSFPCGVHVFLLGFSKAGEFEPNLIIFVKVHFQASFKLCFHWFFKMESARLGRSLPILTTLIFIK